jgi:hypothetical protein
MVAWAYTHYNDAWQYNPDCTAWASRALHEGGQIAYISGFYQNDHYWWRQTTFGITTQTYSYAGAQHLANFLGYNSGSWLSFTYQAVPGDIIFYQYPGYSSINHTAVVTMTNSSTGQLWMTQSDDNYKNTSLTDQQARIMNGYGGYATIYIRHVTM